VREGINIFLAGFVPTENLRFREESLTFKVAHRTGRFLFLGTPHGALCFARKRNEGRSGHTRLYGQVLIPFHIAQVAEVTEVGAEEGGNSKFLRYKYPKMRKTLGNFKLHVDEGEFTDSEIIVMLGENGTGGGAPAYGSALGALLFLVLFHVPIPAISMTPSTRLRSQPSAGGWVLICLWRVLHIRKHCSKHCSRV
jgi:hypothetical protein